MATFSSYGFAAPAQGQNGQDLYQQMNGRDLYRQQGQMSPTPGYNPNLLQMGINNRQQQGQSAMGMGGNQNGWGAAYRQMGQRGQGPEGPYYQQSYQQQQRQQQQPPPGQYGPPPGGQYGPPQGQYGPPPNYGMTPNAPYDYAHNYGGGPTSAFPPPPMTPPQTYQPPQGQNMYGPGNPFGELNNFTGYQDKGMREAYNSYANNYAIPLANYQLQNNAQQYNQYSNARDFGEQQRMNQFNMGLAGQDASRQNQALNFSMFSNQRDYGEQQRQFNQNLGLGYGQLNSQNQFQQGQLQNTQFANQTGRQQVQNQMTLGQMQNTTAQRGQTLDYGLGMRQAANQMTLGQMQNQTAQRGQTLDYSLGNAQNLTAQRGQTLNYGLGQAQNLTAQRGQTLDYSLGKGRLGLDTRQSGMDEAYRYKQLAQQDALQRAQMNNELLQSRYAAFGHAQMPNFRMVNSYA